jgi:hypothetical protein
MGREAGKWMVQSERTKNLPLTAFLPLKAVSLIDLRLSANLFIWGLRLGSGWILTEARTGELR